LTFDTLGSFSANLHNTSLILRSKMSANFGQTQHVLWLSSILSGVIMCRTVYLTTGFLSSLYIKDYGRLNQGEKMEWKNRGFSSFHAILVSSVSFYLVFYSNDFRDSPHDSVSIVFRRCSLSDTMFGISLGYFASDLGMILWLFPALGGKDYCIMGSQSTQLLLRL